MPTGTQEAADDPGRVGRHRGEGRRARLPAVREVTPRVLLVSAIYAAEVADRELASAVAAKRIAEVGLVSARSDVTAHKAGHKAALRLAQDNVDNARQVLRRRQQEAQRAALAFDVARSTYLSSSR
jgi:hypothetical protein